MLAVHLVVSVGWIGAASAYLALALGARWSTEAATVRSAWTAMELIGWSMLIPLAIATVVTGVVLALGTTWGLLRHYWVVVSLTMTVIATAILVLHMPRVTELAATARRTGAPELKELGSDLFHTSPGLVVLVVILGLNVYKPRGLTRYGNRRQREERALRPSPTHSETRRQ